MPRDTKTEQKSTERVRRYRNRIRDEGWTVVEVKVPSDRVEDLRDYAKSLGKPKPNVSTDQMALFPTFD